MELYQMRYVLMLAEELSFSHAAEKLCITQSALSQQIKKFESDLGFCLFERDTKSVKLSSDGAEFLGYVRRVYTEYEKMQQWLNNRERRVNRISFGTSEHSAVLITSALDAFRAKFPAVQVDLIQGTSPALIDMVKDNMLNLALVGLPDNKAIRFGLRVFPVRKEYLCAILGQEHPLHDRKGISMQELEGDTIIMHNRTSRIYYEVTKEFHRLGVHPDILIEENFDAQLQMLREGAVTFVKSNAVTYARHGLYMVRVKPEISTEFALITSSSRKIPPVEYHFIEEISKSMLAAPQGGQ